MADLTHISPDRLDSWKAIAEYLRRDAATVRRWEKTQGLPVRRVPGGRGASVFAYRSEIDQWLKSSSADEAPPVLAEEEAPSTVEEDESPEIAVPPPAPSLRRRWGWHVATAAVAFVAVGLAWRIGGPKAEEGALTVRVTPAAIEAAGPDGVERWRYAFPADERTAPLEPRPNSPATILHGIHPAVLVATSHRIAVADDVVLGGQLMWFTAQGHLEHTFTFDDRLTFGGRTYAAPWAVADYRSIDRQSSRRFAVTAHHFQWWPSIVTVLDDRWQRTGTFVNTGWIERVAWLSPNRLLISGFSNPRDGGMIAILDANALDGQSPPPDDESFHCTSCASAAALRYVVFPRSELNRVTASPFNRAIVDLTPDRIVVHTIEVPSTGAQATDAVYEFSRSLEPLNASFSDRYWEMHRALEAAGKIRHTREHCPERDGPGRIAVWERATGWTSRPVRR